MHDQNFLHRLYRQGKIHLVSPSSDVADAYVRKSTSFRASARILYENERLEESVSLTYYAMFYMVQALLYRCGVKCENHSATILLLHDLFGLENNVLSSAKKERVDTQYYVDFLVTKEEVMEMRENAEDFCEDMLDFLERMGGEEVINYRKKAERMITG